MVICSLMHTCMGGLNKVMAVFMFSPVPAHNKGEICPNLGHVDFLFHDLNLGDMAVQWLTPAPQWLFVLLCGPAINWHLVQGVHRQRDWLQHPRLTQTAVGAVIK